MTAAAAVVTADRMSQGDPANRLDMANTCIVLRTMRFYKIFSFDVIFSQIRMIVCAPSCAYIVAGSSIIRAQLSTHHELCLFETVCILKLPRA